MLGKEQQQIYDLIEKSNQNLFLTGKAGTGKSYLLNYIKENTKKKAVFLAPTGIAAINIGGQTINSFFKIFQHGVYSGEYLCTLTNPKDPQSMSKSLIETIQNIDLLVIDEISMVRSDMYWTIDQLCRYARNNKDEAFGGIQLLLVGDLYQLPPVVSDQAIANYLQFNFGGPYFFNAPDALHNLSMYELKDIYRQKDIKFKQVLNNVREGLNLDNSIDILNTRVMEPPKNTEYITLAGRNYEVDKINSEKLSKIDSKEFTYSAIISGKMNEASYPSSPHLKLKVGAQIMMLTNDPCGRYVNGSIGKVSKLSKNKVEVIINEEVIDVDQYTWTTVTHKYNKETNKMDREASASFTQYPIRLAYAVTIHKSQGQTYDSVYLKMTNAFDYGQTYVALSRCKDFDKLYLASKLQPRDIKISKPVQNFMNLGKEK